MEKQDKNFKIWGVRHSLGGDLIFALPILNYLELVKPKSYKYWVVAKKCANFAPLFFNHPLIDCIRITGYKEEPNADDANIARECDVVLNIAPQHPDGLPATSEKSHWWNYYNAFQETFRMAGFDVNEYNRMPPELQKPKLYQWFDVVSQEKTIAVWPFTSYGHTSPRSPSKDWWIKMINEINSLGYKVLHFGGFNEPEIFTDNTNYKMLTNLPIIEQYKLALGCICNINTNSGSGIILGAYGAKQITLLTDDAPNHTQNLLAFAPLNYKNNNINMFVKGGFDKINYEEIIDHMKIFI